MRRGDRSGAGGEARSESRASRKESELGPRAARRYAASMRAAIAAFALFVAGCASPDAARAPASDAPLTLDLCPFDAPSAAFLDAKDGAPRTLRVEPLEGGESARMILEGAEAKPREIRVTRRGESLFFSGGIDVGTELIRAGARPGDRWDSDRRHVSFDGWERVRLPGADEAARITARRGPAGLEQVETWWFARGVGLVRLKTDHGGIFGDELVRAAK